MFWVNSCTNIVHWIYNLQGFEPVFANNFSTELWTGYEQNNHMIIKPHEASLLITIIPACICPLWFSIKIVFLLHINTFHKTDSSFQESITLTEINDVFIWQNLQIHFILIFCTHYPVFWKFQFCSVLHNLP